MGSSSGLSFNDRAENTAVEYTDIIKKSDSGDGETRVVGFLCFVGQVEEDDEALE